MKKLFLAVALVVAFAAPAMAQNFPNLARTNQPEIRRYPMKKIVLAVALVVAFAAPAMAQNFPNPYSQQ